MIACKDCIHLHIMSEWVTRCHHPKSFIEVPIYLEGTTRTIAKNIELMRSAVGECGHEAILFAAKETPNDPILSTDR
jgi:hypothetical protein